MAPLHDQKSEIVYQYDIMQLKNNILATLHHIDPDMVIERFTAVGDPELLPKGYAGLFESYNVKFIASKRRNVQCWDCKDKNPLKFEDKKPAANLVLIKNMIGDVVDRGTPGLIFWNSGDRDFEKPLKFLSNRGYTILLADRLKWPCYCLQRRSNLIWAWKHLLGGAGPLLVPEDEE